MNTRPFVLFALLTVAVPARLTAQHHDPAPRLAAQREAMGRWTQLDGVWRGTATMSLANGETRVLTQTERIGPFLDGTLKVIEGRGYMPDGRLGFNAFAVISFDPAKQAYTMRSYAHGFSGDFPFKPTPEGFVWEIAAGPATMRYTAVVKDGQWTETGERIEEGKPPVKFIELKLRRVGDTDWPAAGAVTAK